jgi:hypothetical protein
LEQRFPFRLSKARTNYNNICVHLRHLWEKIQGVPAEYAEYTEKNAEEIAVGVSLVGTAIPF